METLALSTVVLDDNARASDDLAGVTLTVDLAKTGPGAEDLGVGNLDEVDLVLSTESLNELDVLGFCARFDEHAKVGLTLVESLSTFTEPTGKTIVNESVLQNLLGDVVLV